MTYAHRQGHAGVQARYGPASSSCQSGRHRCGRVRLDAGAEESLHAFGPLGLDTGGTGAAGQGGVDEGQDHDGHAEVGGTIGPQRVRAEGVPDTWP